ncbi:hypothetical protein O3M35_006316 [Rhynocoris fuscipes]|uniref:Uncharacterized protein n=1 Tax=Rhynocoris fuscipes TaxID=488301 RepID=A0AAW1DIU1_9HEMI
MKRGKDEEEDARVCTVADPSSTSCSALLNGFIPGRQYRMEIIERKRKKAKRRGDGNKEAPILSVKNWRIAAKDHTWPSDSPSQKQLGRSQYLLC